MIRAYYTTTLTSLLDSGFDIGLNDYPIWDESYRNTLNAKIIDRYLFREIGFETPTMFKFYLNRTMNEIMPYYNKLYETTIYKYNPIYNADYTVEEQRTKKDVGEGQNSNKVVGVSSGSVDGNTSGSVTDAGSTTNELTTNDKSVHIDTPQGTVNLVGMTPDSEVVASDVDLKRTDSNGSSSSNNTQSSEGTSHSSSTGNVQNDSTGNSSYSSDSTETYLRKLAGNYGVKTTQAMIQEERDLIIDIDMMVVKELENLFMGLW